jgi:hypothetical protein
LGLPFFLQSTEARRPNKRLAELQPFQFPSTDIALFIVFSSDLFEMEQTMLLRAHYWHVLALLLISLTGAATNAEALTTCDPFRTFSEVQGAPYISNSYGKVSRFWAQELIGLDLALEFTDQRLSMGPVSPPGLIGSFDTETELSLIPRHYIVPYAMPFIPTSEPAEIPRKF